MPCEYRFRRRVQFYETDAAGVVHFSWYFRYMEEAEHALWREAGLSIHPPHGEIGFPRVSTSFEFHRALRFEQEFDVHVRVAAMTKRSIRYTCAADRRGHDNRHRHAGHGVRAPAGERGDDGRRHPSRDRGTHSGRARRMIALSARPAES